MYANVKRKGLIFWREEIASRYVKEAVKKLFEFSDYILLFLGTLVFLFVIIGIVDAFHKHLSVVDTVCQCSIEKFFNFC